MLKIRLFSIFYCTASDGKLLKKSAFTLAEVLITLGIIGIVAAMTLPTLVANHRKKVLQTQFLKTYSDLNNAAILFKANENLTVTEYAKISTSGSDYAYYSSSVLKKFLSYFKGAKAGNRIMSGTTAGDATSAPNWDKELGFTPKFLSGVTIKSGNPCDESVPMQELSGRIYIMDNLLAGKYADLNYGPKICVDINGKKGPNIYGYDWFVFVFKDGVVKPYIGSSEVGYGDDLNDPSKYCNYTTARSTYTCAYYAITDTSPLDPTKSYWKDFLR